MTENITTEPVEAEVKTEWNTEELRAAFEVEGFAAPFVIVKRRSDGQRGTLMFERRGDDRVYFGWVSE